MSSNQAVPQKTPVTLVPLVDAVWAGSQQTYELAVISNSHEIAAGAFYNDSTQGDNTEVPYNYSVQNGVGVISIRGSLTNSGSPYARYFGSTTYPDIRNALMYAVNDQEASSILLEIDSGGGSVAGMMETAQLISTIDKSVKPVYSYTPGNMASAAYALGVSGRSVYASQTSVVGSIGTLAIHTEQSKALKEAGIGVTVVRSGDYKALVNGVEPLTKVAEQQLQAQIDAIDRVFSGWVADKRQMTLSNLDTYAGQGREFVGQQAVSVGLVDSIETFDSVVNKIAALTLDNNTKHQNNSGNFNRGMDMTKQALTDAQILAAQAGVQIAPPGAEGAPATPAAAQQEQQAQAAVEAASQEVTKTEEKNHSAELTSFLRTEWTKAQGEVVKLTAERDALVAQVANLTTTSQAMSKIVASSVSQMKVALGLSAMDLSKLSAESLVAEHTATAEVFVKQFRGGGVAAVQHEPNQATEASVNAATRKARLGAVRLIKQ